MKGSHSRLSFQEAHRYSNVAHVQGAMITDADLTEAAQIHQERDEAQGAAFAGSGIPAQGGMVGPAEDGGALLRSGTVFAQGKQGHFQLGEKIRASADLMEVFAHQADLPHGPNVTEGLVYVDLWERPIMAFEDRYLADAGLHGAETSYRTRTMVQLKTLPEITKLAELPQALSRHPAFKAQGNAGMMVQLKNASTELDACDPCADLISVDKVLPNALVRIEILSVERSKSGSPTSIRLAWSSENAEAVEPLETRQTLERDSAVYEYFSTTTEAQLGYFNGKHVPLRGAFTSDLNSDTPKDPTLPNAEVKQGYTHVRRWDGMVQLALNTRSKANGPSAEAAKPRVTTAEITFETELFALQLNHEKADIIAGDYWLVELRRYAPEDEQALLNGQPLGQPQPPLGPVHHFCPIGISDGKAIQPLPDELQRRLSFPTLADIPASHVGYDANPECDLLGETKNVQQAIDRVCEIDATHVAFHPSDEDCETLGQSRSVDDALNALCRADDNKQLKLMMRTMMDWGVVCGMSVELGNKGIEISGGVALDRSGVLHEIGRKTVQLEELKEEQLLPDPKTFETYKNRNVEICLSLGVRGNDTAYFLSPASLVQGQNDLTLSEQVNACLSGKGSLTESKLFESLPDDPDLVEILTKLHVCLRNDIRPLPGMTFTGAELKRANALLNELINEYGKRLGNAGDPLAGEKVEELQQINEALDQELKNSGLKGSSGQLSLVGSTLKYAAIMKKDEEFRLDCLCSNVVPDCPAIEEGWTLIPLACVDLANYRQGKISVEDVCMMCCRKQANTPRSHRYYNGDMVGQILAGFKELCTEEQLRNDNGPSARLRRWLTEAGQAPWDPPYASAYWPVKPTYGGKPNYSNASGTGLAVLNEWQRADNTPILNVTGLNQIEAQKRLKEKGFNVVNIVSTTNIKSLVSMADNKPLLNRRPQAGDDVVLITEQIKGNDEVTAVEFVVIKQGLTYFRFTPPLVFKPIENFNLGTLVVPTGGKDQPAHKNPKGKNFQDIIKNGPEKKVIDKAPTRDLRNIKHVLDTQPKNNIKIKTVTKTDPKVVEKKIAPKVLDKKVVEKKSDPKVAVKNDPAKEVEKKLNVKKKITETAAKNRRVSLGNKGRGTRRNPTKK